MSLILEIEFVKSFEIEFLVVCCASQLRGLCTLKNLEEYFSQEIASRVAGKG
jgi:hypothetical protein